MEFTSELLQALSKRAWKLSWILVFNALLSLFVIMFIIIDKKLFIPKNFINLEENFIKLLEFFTQSFFISVVIFIIFYILKGDSDNSIKNLRDKFYKKVIDRVNLVFEYRYDFPLQKYSLEIKQLTEKPKLFIKNELEHNISIEKLSSVNVIGIDSLYITYEIMNQEKILFSVWHAGNFIAIAIAIKQELILYSKEDIKYKFENTLNLAGSDNSEVERLSIRDGYWWFDIKYLTSEDFLFNNFEQEQISRKVAHIITVGIPIVMELLEWNKKQ